MNHEQLITDVFRAYYDARKHKRNTISQLCFEMNLEESLVELAHEIENKTYEVGRSICFIVDRPVKREVFAADFRDRVVHHLLYNYLSPLLERTFIHDCYSCRKGFGTLKGINRVTGFVRQCSRNFKEDAYVLKLDISGYFMSINRKHLLSILLDTLDKYGGKPSPVNDMKWKELLDYNMLRYLLEKVVLNDPKADCLFKGSRSNWKGLPKSKSLFYAADDCGLPIGNLTSQLFSNVYLSRLDQYVKREEHAHFYGRYVDDFVVVSSDKEKLKAMTFRIESKLKEWGLTLHPHKRYLQHATKGFDFLGLHQRRAVLMPGRRMKHNGLLCLNEYLGECAKGITPDHQQLKGYLTRFNSYLGLMRHCASRQIREKWWQCLYSQQRAYLLLDGNYTKAVFNSNEEIATILVYYQETTPIIGRTSRTDAIT